MASLLFWVVVQTLTGLPDMAPGTEVRIISRDMITVYAAATVEEDTLAFHTALEPGREIRLLILSPGATDRAALALEDALYGSISPEGNDVLLKFEGQGGPVSFRGWLSEERGVMLVMGAAGGESEMAGEKTEGGAAEGAAAEKAGTGGEGER